jgi:uncharacterized LabA/DUF88 family protein
MITNVYVDGFNLYYGALRGTPFKWLDLGTLCRNLLPKNEIHRIKYFTARVTPRPTDPNQPARQAAYLRALSTLANVEIIYGHFLSNSVNLPLATYSANGKQQYAQVIKTEEKGSDVNIATHMLYDGFRKNYEVAVLVSNDSDLLEPVKLIKNELGLKVGIINPHQKNSRVLHSQATFVKQIRTGVLAVSQFPPVMTDANGTFHKPPIW